MNTPTLFFRILIASALLLSTGACTKFIDFEGEDSTPRLVVNGAFQPDSVFEIELSNSLGFIDISQIQPRTDGSVAVYDGNGSFVDSLTHIGDGRYRSNVTAAVGNTYTVRASSGAFGEVSATDYIPDIMPIDSWDTASAASSDPFFDNSGLDIFFTLSDPAGSENFYMVEVFESAGYYIDYVMDPSTGEFVQDTIYLDFGPQKLYLSTTDQVLLSEADGFADGGELYGETFFFSDRLFNGNIRRFQLRLDYYSGIANLEIRLTSASQSYWRYRRTIDRYDYSSGDPFSEPVQVFTNIEGGLGIWAGFSASSAVIEF
ncbi:MAG: DUF4249 domain-containing protein [Cryomorphaceae bacterium]|nr:DUF4249 domain-containing protein [Flavobacteriales bacterium]